MNRRLLPLVSACIFTSFINGSEKIKKPTLTSTINQCPQKKSHDSYLLDARFPFEIHREIFEKAIPLNTTLENSVTWIHNLSTVSQRSDAWLKIYFKRNTLSLIKQLSNAFNCSNEVAAKTLRTESAINIYINQLAFAEICKSNKVLPIDACIIKKKNIDLNFTYGDNNSTQLILASWNDRSPTSVVKWLIENGADINIPDKQGSTAPSNAILNYIPFEEKYLIEYFWDHPLFDVNKIEPGRWHSESKRTLLSHLIFHNWPTTRHGNPTDWSVQERTLRLTIVKGLLKRGADPELKPTGNRQTPLEIAQESNDQELVTILEKAIAKKHTLL